MVDPGWIRVTGAGLGRIKDALQHSEATKPGAASPRRKVS